MLQGSTFYQLPRKPNPDQGMSCGSRQRSLQDSTCTLRRVCALCTAKLRAITVWKAHIPCCRIKPPHFRRKGMERFAFQEQPTASSALGDHAVDSEPAHLPLWRREKHQKRLCYSDRVNGKETWSSTSVSFRQSARR